MIVGLYMILNASLGPTAAYLVKVLIPDYGFIPEFNPRTSLS
jgi:hypothetical protein